MLIAFSIDNFSFVYAYIRLQYDSELRCLPRLYCPIGSSSSTVNFFCSTGIAFKLFIFFRCSRYIPLELSSLLVHSERVVRGVCCCCWIFSFFVLVCRCDCCRFSFILLLMCSPPVVQLSWYCVIAGDEFSSSRGYPSGVRGTVWHHYKRKWKQPNIQQQQQKYNIYRDECHV